MLDNYFSKLYQVTMKRAYAVAMEEIRLALSDGGNCLDCGAGGGHRFEELSVHSCVDKSTYFGLEWNESWVKSANENKLNIFCHDLNNPLPFPDNTFSCVFALSVLEHLVNGCLFIRECYRVLDKKGTLVILTPNISTYFTAALILLGRMPSTGPHPDSEALINQGTFFSKSNSNKASECDFISETPSHRHLVVFSYLTLKKFLSIANFYDIKGFGFGLYPFPCFMQPILEKIDPYHCHQMVFSAKKL